MKQQQRAFVCKPITKAQQKNIVGGSEVDIIYVQCGRTGSNGEWDIIPADGYYAEPYEACQLHCGRQGVWACMNWGQFQEGVS
jgi:hypothetical protein